MTHATVVIGRRSNLSQRLATLDSSVRLVSAEAVLSGNGPKLWPDEPFRLVINSFQPASRLRDFSQPTTYVQRAILATAMALESLPGSACTKVVYASSASVYGDDVDCLEDTRPKASDLHSGLKIANEKMIGGFCELLDIDFTVVRLFNMYGGNDEFSVVAKIIDAARLGSTLHINNDGNAIRDFVHIDDVAKCFQKVLNATDIPVVNVASGVGVSIRSIIDALKVHGHSISAQSHHRDEIRVSTADVVRLKTLIDVSQFRRVIDHVLSEVGPPDRPGRHSTYTNGRSAKGWN